MILVADSGSTKTQWRWGRGEHEKWETGGLNPHFTSDEQFRNSFREIQRRCGHVNTVYFYGAGCGSALSCERVKDLLISAFPTAQVSVQTDLLAACRATCGNSQGLVGILGTGSNACFYGGYSVVERQRSLGYILGDEGSGCHIGIQLIRDHLAHRLPLSLSKEFDDFIAMDYDTLMQTIYEKPAANRFFASQVPFVLAHRNDSYIHHLLVSSFSAFLSQQVIAKHREYPLHLVGGVAASFRDEIDQASHTVGCRIGKVMAQPIASLAAYHFDSPTH